MAEETFNAGDVYRPIAPFSHGATAGDFVFISGTGGLDNEGTVVSDDVAEQARAMMENVASILDERDLTFDDAVKATVYLTDMDDYEKVNEVYEKYVSDDPPARTCIEASRLPAQERVKIEVIAQERKR